MLTDAIKKDLANRFIHHAPQGNQAERYVQIRGSVLNLAELICDLCPQSRELATALTHLDSAMMFANAAIARNENPVPK